jgi:sensor histidine kinase YesM
MQSIDCKTDKDRYKRVLLTELRDILVLIVIGVVMTWTGLSCGSCRSDTRLFLIVASFTSLMWVALWKGNTYLSDFISTRMSWVQYPLQRFVVGVVSTIAFTLLVVYSSGALYKRLFHLDLNGSMMYSVVITVIISLFMHGRTFLLNWKQTTVDAEKLQKENIAAKYESLKNQVNPHFLFNSLNALTNLVYEDQDKAVKFIKQLSEVYRYVLDTRDKEAVPIDEEVRFLQAYLYLQKIRFGDKLNIEFSLDGVQSLVAPLALQMLIE